jgi:hypothetical protein
MNLLCENKFCMTRASFVCVFECDLLPEDTSLVIVKKTYGAVHAQ